MKRAVVAGHICLDIIPGIDHGFELLPGRLYEVGAPTIGTGGAVSNTGVALHILGVPTTLMGKIGDDSFGSSVLEVLRGYGSALAEGMVVVPGVVTSYTVVVNIPGTDRIFLHCPGANDTFCAADLDEDALDGVAAFHFGYPTFMAATYANDGAELTRMYQRVKELGITTSLDPGMPDPDSPGGQADWLGILQRTLPDVDLFMPSADELLYALDRDRFGTGDALGAADLRPLAERLLKMGTAVAGIKLGARGLYVRTAGSGRLATMGPGAPADRDGWADRELWFPIFRVGELVGTTGAGDTTIAGFLAAMLRGCSLEQAGRTANAVGACNVEAADALSGLQDWDATHARVDAGWETAALDIAEEGWQQDDATGIWTGPADKTSA